MRERQLVGGSVETETAQRRSKRRIRALEHIPRRREHLGEILSHAGLLGALSGK
jgi:hypothetical protein